MRSVNLIVCVAAVACCTAGASGVIRNTRTGSTYTTVAAAVSGAISGDTIEIEGTYTGSAVFATISKNLTIRGVGGSRAVLDANYTCPNNQGILITSSSSNVTVENIEFRNCRGASGGNGCGIRIVGKNITIRNCYFHDNENGIMGNPSSQSGSSVLVEYSEFSHNGFGDSGYTHNIYIGTYETFTLRHSWSHNTYVGHEVKTRARNNYILYNRIGNEDPNPEGANASYEINVPQGGLTYIIGNQVHQGPYTSNSGIISYAEEGATNPDLHLYVINNTIVNTRGSGTFVRVAAGTALLQNNIFQGTGTIVNGTATQVSNYVGNANLVNSGAFDFHLTAASTNCINKGSIPVPSTGVNGFSLIPVSQYVHPYSQEARPIDSLIDIGAYEYVAPNQSPTVNAGADVAAMYEGRPVSLHATGSDPDNDTLSYTWTQTAGKSVSLAGAGTPEVSFTAPALATKAESLLTLQVQVADGKGGTASDTVSVQVYMKGDATRDHKVNVFDLQRLGASWNKQLGDAGYDAACDFNGDNKVNVFDLQAMGANWNKTLP